MKQRHFFFIYGLNRRTLNQTDDWCMIASQMLQNQYKESTMISCPTYSNPSTTILNRCCIEFLEVMFAREYCDNKNV